MTWLRDPPCPVLAPCTCVSSVPIFGLVAPPWSFGSCPSPHLLPDPPPCSPSPGCPFGPELPSPFESINIFSPFGPSTQVSPPCPDPWEPPCPSRPCCPWPPPCPSESPCSSRLWP